MSLAVFVLAERPGAAIRSSVNDGWLRSVMWVLSRRLRNIYPLLERIVWGYGDGIDISNIIEIQRASAVVLPVFELGNYADAYRAVG